MFSIIYGLWNWQLGSTSEGQEYPSFCDSKLLEAVLVDKFISFFLLSQLDGQAACPTSIVALYIIPTTLEQSTHHLNKIQIEELASIAIPTPKKVEYT